MPDLMQETLNKEAALLLRDLVFGGRRYQKFDEMLLFAIQADPSGVIQAFDKVKLKGMRPLNAIFGSKEFQEKFEEFKSSVPSIDNYIRIAVVSNVLKDAFVEISAGGKLSFDKQLDIINVAEALHKFKVIISDPSNPKERISEAREKITKVFVDLFSEALNDKSEDIPNLWQALKDRYTSDYGSDLATDFGEEIEAARKQLGIQAR